MIAILALAAFGITFASGEDAQPQPQRACAPFSDCTAQLKMSESVDQAMQANDFDKFCQIVESFYNCLDNKHAETQCKNDSSFKAFNAMLLICQPPQRRVFAAHVECTFHMFDTTQFNFSQTETAAVDQCVAKLVAKGVNASSNSNQNEVLCSSMNAHYECNRAPVVRKCGTAFHNAMLDVSGPMLDSRAPGCKLNVKKIISSAGKVVSSFIVLGIGLVSARFYIILLP